MIGENKKLIALTLVAFSNAVDAIAQIEELPQPQAKGPGPPGLPIDNGLIILFAIAIIYGVYKIVQRSKKAA